MEGLWSNSVRSLRRFAEAWVAGEVVEVRGGARSLHRLLGEMEGRTTVVQWCAA